MTKGWSFMNRTNTASAARTVVIAVAVASVGITGCSSDPSALPSSATTNAATTDAVSTNAPTTNAVTTNARTTNAATLVDFADRAAAESWSSQNDTVMGGRSKGAASWAAGALMFAGSVSLENNGGFSSVVGDLPQRISPAAAPIDSISVLARGDGKTYVLQLRADDDSVRYVQRFTTEVGVERRYSLALAAFEPVNFQLSPLKSAPQVDPFAVTQLAFYILDKQAGPFELSVRRVDAIG